MTKTILITGASSGIGRATAELFHKKGWNVLATMRNPKVETELTKLENVLVTRLDVTDQSSITKAIQQGIERFGKIDVVLNNAGYGAFGALEAASKDTIQRQFQVNVFGLLDVIQAILPYFRKAKQGMIVNVSSIGGRMGIPFFSLYHGTKFAVEGITESLQYELGAFGVKVKLIEPGVIKTDFAGRSLEIFNDESFTEYQEFLQKFLRAREEFEQEPSTPDVVADVIYTAVTDGTDQLRYSAGEDAKRLLEMRKNQTDEEFSHGMMTMFGLV